MTTLGSLVKSPSQPLDIPTLVASIAPGFPGLPSFTSLTASVQAWINQDDDAHEPCSLTACRHPLHPGPCKGWKGTLNSVSPGTYKQIEEARVEKANARRVKRIADLRSQGKPIPRSLLTEIKAKPAPVHPAHNAQAVPLGQVNQKADLAGGQAHAAGQAVSKAAGVQVKTPPPLPLGPKQKKPTVAGRGPAFVITQPKVTDTYKLDKADKITPQEWAGLTDADKTTIRNELTAIKARGFGPQQTKADALLAKLPASGTVGNTLKSGTPGTITTPSGKVHQAVSVTPGKVSLGQAAKTVTPQLPAPAPSPKRGTRDQHGILNTPKVGGPVSSTSVGLPSGYRITRDGMGYSLKHNGKLIRTSTTQAALEQYAKDHAKAITDVVAKHNAAGPPKVTPMHAPSLPDQVKADQMKAKAAAAPAAPSAPATPKPAAPAVLPAHVQAARAVAARTFGGAPTGKKHLTAYGQLSKADFDNLDDKTQRIIRDDLANAKGKFLDPKKQQAATDLLDRFGSRHTAPAAPAAPKSPDGGGLPTGYQIVHVGMGYGLQRNGKTIRTQGRRSAASQAELEKFAKEDADRLKGAPSTPAHPKGYSDPQQEVVKAATSGLVDTDKILQTVARLSPDSVGKLDDSDRKAVLGRLAFVATHPKATAEQKAKATAYGRIVNGNTRVPDSVKFDHTPSIGELHAEEQKGGHAAAFDALIAAQDKTLDRGARVKALSALTKPQFDALPPVEQRLVTDALHELHTDQRTPSGIAALDVDAEKALTTYTGAHPGIHLLRQAEADFRAGKITADELWSQFLHARVASPTKMYDPKSPGALLEKEAQRVAEDNPKLPIWLRADLIDNPYGATGGTYHSIARAQNKYNFEPAPRLTPSDISDIFRASEADLAASHPIHAEAVRALRLHVIETGLPLGSPWSSATQNHVVDNLLHISGSEPEIPPERLKEFQALPLAAQAKVRTVMRRRIDDASTNYNKTQYFIAMRELDGRGKYPPDVQAALLTARNSYPGPTALDTYRRLTPNDFDAFPSYVQGAIKGQLDELQKRAERNGPVSTWSTTDNPFKVMPGTLADHLSEMRTVYTDRRTRAASDIANFGTKIINPFDRTRVYSEVPIGQFRAMSQGDQNLVNADLDKIAHDTGNPLPIRYNALMTKDFRLSTPANLNVDQVDAISQANPAPGSAVSDHLVEMTLNDLSANDFHALDQTYRDAIDERIKQLPGPSQQLLNAKFHPAAAAAPAATPGGYTPTTVQPTVPPHVQAALDTIYGVHSSGKSHTMAHQLSTYGALRGSDFGQLNPQEQGHLLGDLSFIATTAKGPSADKARKLIDRFTPPGTPSGQVPTGAAIPPANAVPGQVRYATPLKGLEQAKDSGTSGDGWISLPGGGRVWGAHGAAGLLLQHVDPQTGEKRYLMVQRGPAISDPGKWTFPGGASDSKETPHQGAARETIEELGLKADSLKDALVHGDHTFSVPNHSWKYTTVAAQVPTMIKPNLTTAHARAETSDAKWMTIDEIRALDKSGQLHGPIAGGKLEQNVISLYPQGSGQTLGQVARPGPVTKRLGRLRLPSGGRQAPATFNAWPHAHKPSTGKNLVADKTSIDAQRQKIKQDRTLYDGKTADGRLAAIGAQQGFDATPTVLDKKEIDRLLATGDYIEAWRGVTGAGGGWSARSRGGSGGKTAAEINEEMRTGPAYYGKGIFGNGYYLATQRRVAAQYADNSHGSMARILIPKSAIMEKYDKVEKEAQANSSRTSKAKGSGGYEISTFWDPGRWGAAKGLDGIEINPHHRAHGGGGARHVAAHGQPAFNWLNRSVLIVQKEPG